MMLVLCRVQLFYLACTEDSAIGLSRALQLASYFCSETLAGPPYHYEPLDDLSDLLVPVQALHRVRTHSSSIASLRISNPDSTELLHSLVKLWL